MKSVQLSDELHAQMKVRCAEQRIKIKDLVECMFEGWLNGTVKVPITPAKVSVEPSPKPVPVESKPSKKSVSNHSWLDDLPDNI